MEQKKETEKELLARREKYRHKAFVMMLEIGVIIAIPAFSAFGLGKLLESRGMDSKKTMLALLFAAFVISWSIIIAKYRNFNRKMREVDSKIKELKDDKDVDNTDSGR